MGGIRKITELSVGNYVKVNYGLGENQIFKIERIDKDGWIDMSNKEMDKNFSLGHSVKELDPVYIQDVIDKLYFEKKVDGGFEYYQIFSDDYLDVRMEDYNDGMYEVRATNCEFNMPPDIILTSCVHTLQNFLTMIDVDIKIEL